MERPMINYDVALQYETGMIPSVEAMARGKQDFIYDALGGTHSKNPYRSEELRAYWLRGYIAEQCDFRSAVMIK